MNGDQKERAKKWVAIPSSWVAPALSGALCAALENRHTIILCGSWTSDTLIFPATLDEIRIVQIIIDYGTTILSLEKVE
jgi:hypothetical protein